MRRVKELKGGWLEKLGPGVFKSGHHPWNWRRPRSWGDVVRAWCPAMDTVQRGGGRWRRALREDLEMPQEAQSMNHQPWLHAAMPPIGYMYPEATGQLSPRHSLPWDRTGRGRKALSVPGQFSGTLEQAYENCAHCAAVCRERKSDVWEPESRGQRALNTVLYAVEGTWASYLGQWKTNKAPFNLLSPPLFLLGL